MDTALARMFDLNRPLAERIEERNLKESFVKSASSMGIDLSNLSDVDVNSFYGKHLATYFEHKAQLLKEAELVRVGRFLAQKMFKHAQEAGSGARSLAEASEKEFANYVAHMAGTPEGRIELLRNQEWLTSKGLHPSSVKELHKSHLQSSNPSLADFELEEMSKERTKHLQDIYDKEGIRAATERSLRTAEQGLATEPEALLKKYTIGKVPESSMLSKWGPSGLMKALQEGNMGVVGRKLLPIGGLGLGLGYLLKKKNEERERQLAASQLLGSTGRIPAVGV